MKNKETLFMLLTYAIALALIIAQMQLINKQKEHIKTLDTLINEYEQVNQLNEKLLNSR